VVATGDLTPAQRLVPDRLAGTWRFEAEWETNGPVCVQAALRAQRALTCKLPPCSQPVGKNGGWVLTEFK
jgi:hypothetical protein